jgi:prepilin-type N-terminal cleavage/methylation domain-containing protein
MNWMQRAVARKAEEEREAGFTLIELLVVILILGILSAIVVVSISGFSGSGKKQACIASGQAAEAAAAAYYADQTPTPSFPTNLSALSPTYLKTDPTLNPDYGSKLAAGYSSSTGQVDTSAC